MKQAILGLSVILLGAGAWYFFSTSTTQIDAQAPIRLIKPEAFYLFADPELEALPAGQKVLLRMGSTNAGRVKAKLQEVRDLLVAAG